MNPFGALFRPFLNPFEIPPIGTRTGYTGCSGRRAQQRRRQNRGGVEGLPERRRLWDPLVHATLKVLHFTQ